MLPLLDGTWPEPTFTPGAGTTSESEEGIVWSVTDDVLHRTTVAHTLSESEYDGPYGGRVREHYQGEVRVDRRTFEQRALATTVFGLTWPEAAIEVSADLDVRVGPTGYDVTIETRGTRDGEEVHRWSTTVELPRYTVDDVGGNR